MVTLGWMATLTGRDERLYIPIEQDARTLADAGLITLLDPLPVREPPPREPGRARIHKSSRGRK